MANSKDDIKKYLNGELTPAEMHRLEKEALSDPFLAEALEGYKDITASNLEDDLAILETSLQNRISQSKTTSFWSWPLRIAAGLLLLAAASFMVYYFSSHNKQENAITMRDTKETQSPPTSALHATDSAYSAEQSVNDEADEIMGQRTKRTESSRKQGTASSPTATSSEPSLMTNAAPTEATVEKAPDGMDDNPNSTVIEKIETRETLAKADKPPSQNIPGYIEPSKKETALFRSKNDLRSFAAPTKTIRGKVTDADDGDPLPGVNVVVKGTDIGTVTDMDGTYNITLPDSSRTLVFSFIGLQSEEKKVPTSNEVNLAMNADISQLSEVVVVGDGEAEIPEGTLWQLAEPEGGRKEYKLYLEKNLTYPELALKNEVEGKVAVQFTVTPAGQLTDFRILKSLGYGCDEEVIRLIKQGPKWNPTKRNDQPVKGRVKIKMKFQLPKKN